MTPKLDRIREEEDRLARAVAVFVPDLGVTRQSLDAGAKRLGMSDGARDLIAPSGVADIAAVLWRLHDAPLHDPATAKALNGMKIREKIAFLLNLRLDEGAADEAVARRLMGWFALPHHAVLYHRLLWATADTIWKLAGDKALDENHYSKRVIVSGILSTAMLTRLAQGREAQLDQVARNIEAVMAYEKFKAGITFKPEQFVLDVARTLGRLRFANPNSKPTDTAA